MRRGLSNGKLLSLVIDARANDVAGVTERRGVRTGGWHRVRIAFELAFFTGTFGGSDGRNGAFLTNSLPFESVDDDDRDGDRVRFESDAAPNSSTFDSESDIFFLSFFSRVPHFVTCALQRHTFITI